MKSVFRLATGFLAASPLLFAGCASFFGEIENESPTLRMLRGELAPGEYREAVTETNKREQAREAFEHNRESTRAFNRKTGKFEYVPEDTEQEWNSETERWEFTPKREE